MSNLIGAAERGSWRFRWNESMDKKDGRRGGINATTTAPLHNKCVHNRYNHRFKANGSGLAVSNSGNLSFSLSFSSVFTSPSFLSFFLSLSFDLFSFPFVSRYSPLPIFSPLINEWWRRGWPQMAEVSLGRHFSFMFAFGSSSAVFPPLIQQYLFNSSNYYSLFVAVAVAVVEWTTKPFWEKANWFWKWNWKFLHVGKWITR